MPAFISASALAGDVDGNSSTVLTNPFIAVSAPAVTDFIKPSDSIERADTSLTPAIASPTSYVTFARYTKAPATAIIPAAHATPVKRAAADPASAISDTNPPARTLTASASGPSAATNASAPITIFLVLGSKSENDLAHSAITGVNFLAPSTSSIRVGINAVPSSMPTSMTLFFRIVNCDATVA